MSTPVEEFEDLCVICGESEGDAEMWDPTGEDNGEGIWLGPVTGGVVHADCGLARGWEVA